MLTNKMLRYFLGANSSQGFYSLYDQLIDPAGARCVYILKGGPGCGKSSLMRRVGQAAEQAGRTVEYISCSGDPDSLDAILLPELPCALVDGTAPQERAPKGHRPGAGPAAEEPPQGGISGREGEKGLDKRQIFYIIEELVRNGQASSLSPAPPEAICP